MHKRTNSQRGFSLLEMLVAATLGLIVMLAMLSLFRTGMRTTIAVTQRAETQQNLRAGMELMSKDLSMAGAGLPSGGLQLPPAASLIACNQARTCYVNGNTYPNANFMYGIIPNFSNGVENNTGIVNTPGVVNDFTFPNDTSANVTVINNAVSPNNILAPGGLNVGDVMLFLVTSPGNGQGPQGNAVGQTAAAVAEITGIPNGGAIDFAANDALNFNQVGAANSLATIAANFVAGSTLTACRLNVVTYFLQVPPAGGTVQTPRLMRQVNGLNAVPVADNIINLQFSYDVIDSINQTMSANQSNPIGAGLSPAYIQKVNIWMMGQGLLPAGGQAQSMYLASSVSMRNMSFCNSYGFSTTQCN
jgi:prepilin-type N-terminal cleavage/methylation domain-containing protein